MIVSEHGVGIEIRIGIESGEVVATPTDARQRLVTGEAVGIAAKLEQLAGSGEIVVGELAGRLIDHAAVLEPLGELEIKGKRDPVRAYRLVELAPVAPAFETQARRATRRSQARAGRRCGGRSSARSTAARPVPQSSSARRESASRASSRSSRAGRRG